MRSHRLAKGFSCVFAAVWIFALLCALAEPARAYVDPGSGLLLFQVTGSLITGLLFLVRQKIRRLFRRFLRSGDAETAAPGEQQ